MLSMKITVEDVTIELTDDESKRLFPCGDTPEANQQAFLEFLQSIRQQKQKVELAGAAATERLRRSLDNERSE